MQKIIDEPILIIKTAWGGKSLNTDFRPPSAGPYEFREADLKRLKEAGKDVEKIQADRTAATGVYYRLMIDHVKKVLADPKRVYPNYDPKEGCELAGFVWFQGWNDMVNQQTYPDRDKPGGYDDYSKVLVHFIREVRKDLSAPKLPFVIGVMGAGGPIDKYPPEKQRYAGIHGEFRKAMAAPAALPEFKGSVAAVMTEDYWDMELEELRAKDKELQKEVKALKEEGKLGGDNEKVALEMRRKEVFTPREREILEKGASNAEYHYLGSAKILGQIGKAFAEALAGVTGEQKND
jgi:alpha-galactosidase